MQVKIKHIVYIIIAALIFFGGFKVKDYFADKQLQEARLELKKERIKNDTLKKVTDGLYTKLAADTLTIRDLKRVSDSLSLELKKPAEIVYIQAKPQDKEADTVDVVVVKDTTVTIEDFYPQKETFFVRYTSSINTKRGVGESKWNFQPISISIGLEENKDGTWKSNIKVPEFLTISKVDVLSKPRNSFENVDNFDFIMGGGLSKNFLQDQTNVRANIGLRYKDFIIIAGATTDAQTDITLNYQF